MPSQAAFALVAAIIHGGMAVLVLLLRRKRPLHWAFLRLELGLFVWNAGLVGSHLAGNDILWLKLMYSGVATLAPSAVIFTGRLLGWNRTWMRATVGPALACSAIFIIWLLTTHLVPVDEGRHVLSRLQRDFLVGYTFPFLVFCAVFVLWLGLRASTRLMKRHYLILGVGSLVCIAAGLTDFLPGYGYAVPPLGNLVIAAFGILLYLTVVRAGLLSIRLFIRRFLVALVCLLLLGGLYGLASQQLEGDVWFPSALATTLILLAAFSLLREDSPTSRRLRRLLGEGPRFAEIVAAADAELPRAEDVADLGRRALDLLHRQFPIESSALLYRERPDSPEVVLARTGRFLPSVHPAHGSRIANPCLREELAFQISGEESTKRRAVLEWMDRERVDALHWLDSGNKGALLIRFRPRSEIAAEEFAEVCRVLEDRMLATLETLNARAEAERAKRLAALGQMAAAMAHEIKNPLAAMHSSAQFLEGEELGEEARACAMGIREESERLSESITHLLRYARPPALQPVDCDINDYLERVVVSLRPGLDGLDVSVNKSEAPLVIELDPSQIRQVLLNLLLNAKAFATRAEISVESTANGARVMVCDNGPGVQDELRDWLFEPFSTSRNQGTGLGLAISRSIVEAHGGTLYLEAPDEEEGPGACFVLVLPRTAKNREKTP